MFSMLFERKSDADGRTLPVGLRYAALAASIFSVLALTACLTNANETNNGAKVPIGIMAGTDTPGGLQEGMRILRVTNLEDSGEGSLREALEARGPRLVVFDIAGTIRLKRDLRIDSPFITVAGQTAPDPGIRLLGKSLSIKTEHVVIQHLTIRPTPSSSPDENRNLDGITISECSNCDRRPHSIRLENISVSWGVDENIGIWGESVSNITIRSSIIAEGLLNAGHPKGEHSMGLLIGKSVEGVEVVGNLFASNMRRNPVISGRASAFVANNYIYNPRDAAMHLFDGPFIRATFAANIVKSGPDSDRDMQALAVDSPADLRARDSWVWYADNHCCTGQVTPSDLNQSKVVEKSAHTLPSFSESWRLLPASQVWAWTSRYAGARPASRNPTDARILAGVRSGKGRIITDLADVGGVPDWPMVAQRARVPQDPFAPSSIEGKSRLQAWLCLRHFEVGGPETEQCSESPSQLEEVLGET